MMYFVVVTAQFATLVFSILPSVCDLIMSNCRVAKQKEDAYWEAAGEGQKTKAQKKKEEAAMRVWLSSLSYISR